MLSLGELPEDAEGSFFEMNDESIRDLEEPQPIEYTHALYAPASAWQSVGAPRSLGDSRIAPTFSREDLLNLK